MKKLARTGLALLFTLTLLFSMCGGALAASVPKISIDSPSGGYITGTALNISGWSIDRRGVRTVKVYVNGKLAASAATGLSRTDVGKVYPSYAGSARSGFQASLNTAAYAPGNYTFKVVSAGVSGATASKSFVLTKAAPRLNLDTPKGNCTVTGGLTISGWSLSAAGVKEVDVSVDGKQVPGVSAAARPDVNNIMNKGNCYPGAANAGFSVTLPYYTGISKGPHQIKVTSVGNDGAGVSSSFTATVKIPGALASIDSSVKFMTGSFTVTGWSLNKSGVKAVEVYLNGNSLGAAQTGLASASVASTVDADNSFPNGSAAGYSFTLPDTSAYAPGNYTLRVVSTGNDGTTAAATAVVVKLPARVNIDTPLVGTTVGGDFTVAGWAVAPGGVSSVQVSLNGTSVSAQAVTGGSRPDVQRVLSGQNGGDGYANSATSGYSATLNLDTVPNGSYTLTVTAAGQNDGTSATLTRPFKVSKTAPQSKIETPAAGGFMTNTLTVAGWSVSESGVKSVEVFLDDQDLGAATVGLARTDIAAQLQGKGYKYINNTGFSFTKSGLDSVKTGAHTVKIVSTGTDGDQSVSTAAVTKAAPAAGFDAAYQNYTTGNADFTVTAYALSSTGITQVQLYDGAKLLDTQTAPVSSPDIQTQYDPTGTKYINSALARYTFHVSINMVPNGTQTLTVKATSTDGSTAQANTTVNVNKPAPLGVISSPASGDNLTFYDTTFTVSGWMLNASGVASISVLVDGVSAPVTAGLASPSDAVTAAGSLYPNGQNAGFSAGPIDATSLSYSNHTITVTATGNDGNVYTLTEIINKSRTAYTQYTLSLASFLSAQQKIYGGYPSSWGVSVSQSDVDPDAILQADSSGLYEFLNLQYNSNTITAAQINSVLNVPGVKNNVLAGHGQAFIDAANLYHVNPVYLAAHARLETGNGTSKLAQGVSYSGQTVYDMFGIAAVDSNPIQGGAKYAYAHGWTSIDKAIVGGAQYIHDHYVFAADMGHPPTQNTLYKMKWDPDDVENGISAWEYATGEDWAHSIAGIIAQNSSIFNGYALTFDIPQYQ